MQKNNFLNLEAIEKKKGKSERSKLKISIHKKLTTLRMANRRVFAVNKLTSCTASFVNYLLIIFVHLGKRDLFVFRSICISFSHNRDTRELSPILGHKPSNTLTQTIFTIIF